jgi:hypothetical protein
MSVVDRTSYITMPRIAFTHSWLEDGLISSLHRAIRLLDHDIPFIPSNNTVTFLAVTIMNVKVKNISHNIFSGNWLHKNGVHIQCCTDVSPHPLSRAEGMTDKAPNATVSAPDWQADGPRKLHCIKSPRKIQNQCG